MSFQVDARTPFQVSWTELGVSALTVTFGAPGARPFTSRRVGVPFPYALVGVSGGVQGAEDELGHTRSGYSFDLTTVRGGHRGEHRCCRWKRGPADDEILTDPTGGRIAYRIRFGDDGEVRTDRCFRCCGVQREAIPLT